MAVDSGGSDFSVRLDETYSVCMVWNDVFNALDC